MRAKPIMMPPARGMAPPLSPVPAPRPTTGTPCSRRRCTMATTSSVERGKDDHVGPGLVDAAVVFVEAEVFRPVQVAARTDDADQSLFPPREQS